MWQTDKSRPAPQEANTIIYNLMCSGRGIIVPPPYLVFYVHCNNTLQGIISSFQKPPKTFKNFAFVLRHDCEEQTDCNGGFCDRRAAFDWRMEDKRLLTHSCEPSRMGNPLSP